MLMVKAVRHHLRSLNPPEELIKWLYSADQKCARGFSSFSAE